MKKVVLFFAGILSLCLLFTACPSGYFSDDSLFISVDKNEYSVNDDIEFILGGRYSSEEKVRTLYAGFSVYKYDDDMHKIMYKGELSVKSINGMLLKDSDSNVLVVNSIPDIKVDGNIYFKQYSDGSFKYDYSKKKGYFTDINESVVFSLSDPGKYLVNAQITMTSRKYGYYVNKTEYFNLTVTE